ncbi:MAG: PIN domain nuclease [Chloroflexi bacterium]|nr:PIN domain nuclease [Chloroflexota bacterium]
MSFEFIFRLIGAILGAIGGGMLGSWLSTSLETSVEGTVVLLGLVGFLAGLILTPFLTTRPLRFIAHRLSVMSPDKLTAVLAGLFTGLVAAALLTLPLSLLPSPFGQIAPLVAAIAFCYLSIVIFIARREDLQTFISNFRSGDANGGGPAGPIPKEDSYILLDTSVIIDGRIADISRTGFIRDTFLVPNFILFELQHIADSADPLRRNRGRRGLEILAELQNETIARTEIRDIDVSEAREADTKLVALARHLRCPIMTNDYNLNRVSEIQGVAVLNVNDLANAVKSIFLPGETLSVKIIQQGREMDQGVGYLPDGTMVVVENGSQLMDNNTQVTVTKVLQTSAGRMIFAKT